MYVRTYFWRGWLLSRAWPERLVALMSLAREREAGCSHEPGSRGMRACHWGLCFERLLALLILARGSRRSVRKRTRGAWSGALCEVSSGEGAAGVASGFVSLGWGGREARAGPSTSEQKQGEGSIGQTEKQRKQAGEQQYMAQVNFHDGPAW